MLMFYNLRNIAMKLNANLSCCIKHLLNSILKKLLFKITVLTLPFCNFLNKILPTHLAAWIHSCNAVCPLTPAQNLLCSL